jgi:hypothetical protein
MRRIAATIALLAAVGGSTVAPAAQSGYTLSLVVPVRCQVTFGAGAVAPVSDGVGLGTIHEYCNAAGGYDLVVHYAPGTLDGTVLIAGDDDVTLDGSGSAVIARSPIPRIRQRTLVAIPGPNGFDSDRLELEVVASNGQPAQPTHFI